MSEKTGESSLYIVEKTRRKRQEAWSKEEKSTLLKLILDRIKIVESNACNKLSRDKKKQTWLEIKNLFEAKHGRGREMIQIRRLWNKLRRSSLDVRRSSLQCSGGHHDISSHLGASKAVQTEEKWDPLNKEVDSNSSSEIIVDKVILNNGEPEPSRVNYEELIEEEEVTDCSGSNHYNEEFLHDEDMIPHQEADLLRLHKKKVELEIKELESRWRREEELHEIDVSIKKQQLKMIEQEQVRKTAMFVLKVNCKKRTLHSLENQCSSRHT